MSRVQPLTREVIVDAALAHADSGDLESLSTRALAADLDVTPMALYRHVRNKDEILAAVVDVLLRRIGLPSGGGDWQSWMEELARSLRQLLVEHPVAIAVFTREPVTTAAARRRLTAAVEVLAAAGFSDEEAVRAYAAVHTYTVGFCALDAAQRSAVRTALPGRGDVPDDESTPIRAFVNDGQFVHGLRALLRGLALSKAPGDKTRRQR